MVQGREAGRWMVGPRQRTRHLVRSISLALGRSAGEVDSGGLMSISWETIGKIAALALIIMLFGSFVMAVLSN